ncbi:MAG TPA: ABC transporter permease [Chloroflexi bacterium]|nr:ABC transporter permease [Chloroflexota bacterium]HHW88158.1 ABC transporter permease [Chloroflexota bacterium]
MFETQKANLSLRCEPPSAWSWRSRLVRHQTRLAAPLVLLAVLALWALLVAWQDYPPFILPSPALVWQKFLLMAATGSLLLHIGVTLLEIALGLLIGLSAAFALGYLLGKHRTLEHLASPYIVASQSIPIVAIAPLVVIWMGSGLASKVAVTALITFFPALIATIVGIRSVDPDLHDLMHSLRASRSQLFWKLELPAALPIIFGGLKLSATLAVVGAVVGEFMGANAGLGYLVNLGRGLLDTPMMFVAILLLVVIAQALHFAVAALEARLLRWQRV